MVFIVNTEIETLKYKVKQNSLDISAQKKHL